MENEKLNVLSVYHLHNPSLMMEQINLAHVLPGTLPRCHEDRMQMYSLNFSWQCSQLFTSHYIELNWFKQRMLQINFTLDMGNHRHTNPSRAVMSKHETIEATIGNKSIWSEHDVAGSDCGTGYSYCIYIHTVTH